MPLSHPVQRGPIKLPMLCIHKVENRIVEVADVTINEVIQTEAVGRPVGELELLFDHLRPMWRFMIWISRSLKARGTSFVHRQILLCFCG